MHNGFAGKFGFTPKLGRALDTITNRFIQTCLSCPNQAPSYLCKSAFTMNAVPLRVSNGKLAHDLTVPTTDMRCRDRCTRRQLAVIKRDCISCILCHKPLR